MEHKEKKPYSKPMVAYINKETDSPELLAEIRAVVERCQAENGKQKSDSENPLYILEKVN